MTEHATHIGHQAVASYPLRSGNAVRPLIDGEVAFRRICTAVQAACHSVWVTIAWIRRDFVLPDGHGSVFDLLDEAAARGLEVRVIFWRPSPETNYVSDGTTFAGTDADRQFLATRGARFAARWDRAAGNFCQHQKCWVIDAGQEAECAFVGGINLNPQAMVSPGHAGGGGIHDAYVEIKGPSATDVHHNFVQRWNEASERAARDGVWGHRAEIDLQFPDRSSSQRGASSVQIQRNLHSGLYGNAHPAAGAPVFPVAEGEHSIRQQYLDAINGALETIYIENQALSVSVIVEALRYSLLRGSGCHHSSSGGARKLVRLSSRQPRQSSVLRAIVVTWAV
jgi:cardiolipin synthase A/B